MNPTQAEFNPPTTYKEDGAAIVAGDIDKFVLSIGKTQGGPYPFSFNDLDIAPNADGKIIVPLDSFGVLQPGTYYGVAFAHTAAGVQSDASEESSFTLETPVHTPNPPTALRFV